MAIILYEGFNSSTTDVPKINTNYWSSNYLNDITYAAGRTNNQIRLPSYPFQANQLTVDVTKLTLSQFSDPLLTNDCFGIGMSHGANSLTTNYGNTSGNTLNRSKYMEFRDGANNLVLSFNFIKTTYQGVGSMGLEVVQNENIITVYDFSSYSGASWTVTSDSQQSYINSRVYLEFFIDAKNENKMSIRVSQDDGTINGYLLNSNGQQETTITTFSSLGSVSWFARHDAFGTFFTIDDLYFSRGDTSEECYLGSSIKIHRLILANNTDTIQWISNNTNSQFSNLNNADGDLNYVYASLASSGTTSLFTMQDLPSIPAGDISILVKPINIARTTSITDSAKFINVISDGSGDPAIDLGSEHIVSSNNYLYKTEDYIVINPITGNPWTVDDINNMQIGIKNLGIVS